MKYGQIKYNINYMKGYIYILLISLFIYILCSFCKEGFINKPLKDKPDDLQFYACHDYSSNQNLGNNNYKIKRHGVVEPQVGAYSSFLDIYKLRNYDEIFHSPICESEYNFKDIQVESFKQLPIIFERKYYSLIFNLLSFLTRILVPDFFTTKNKWIIFSKQIMLLSIAKK